MPVSWSPQQELQAQATMPSFLCGAVSIAPCYSVLCSELKQCGSPSFTGFIFWAVVFLFSCVSPDSVPSSLSSCVCSSPHFSGIIFRFFFFWDFPSSYLHLWSCIFCFASVLFFVGFLAISILFTTKGSGVTWVFPAALRGSCSSSLPNTAGQSCHCGVKGQWAGEGGEALSCN